MTPNELVSFELILEYIGDAAADIRTEVYGPSGATVRYAPDASLKVGSTDTAVIQAVTDTTLVFGAQTASARLAVIKGFCQNGANEGYLGLKWSQLVADPSDTKVLAGISSIKIKRMQP